MTKQQLIDTLTLSRDLMIENINDCRYDEMITHDELRDLHDDAHVLTCIIALIQTLHDDVITNVIDDYESK